MNIIQARAKIVAREEFTAGNVKARAHGHFGVGLLPNAFHDEYERARKAKDFYAVYSYNTPIAWYANGSWTVPDVKYSVTTEKQKTRAGIRQLVS